MAPEEVAQGFVAQLGPQNVAQIVATLSADMIIAAILAMPDGMTSPLVRREGQKFVRDLWEQMKRHAGG